jgi:hypothetical protein
VKPTLVCLNNGRNTLTRYVPKPMGGFWAEGFEIVDKAEFAKEALPTVVALQQGAKPK